MEGNREIGSDPNRPDRLRIFQGRPGADCGKPAFQNQSQARPR